MIRTKKAPKELVIDLTGPDGNAFTLMATAVSLARQFGKDGKAIREEMMTGDYEHLLSVFDREFGAFVILER